MTNDYYVIEAKSSEWVFVLTNYVNTHPDKEELSEMDVRVVVEPSTWPTFYLSRAKFTSEDIGRLLGADPEAISRSKKIKLGPLDPRDYPEPTVNYWGRA